MLALLASTAGRADEPPFERVDGLILPAGEWALRSAAIEAGGRYAYFGRFSLGDPSRVMLVNLQTFERVTSREILDIAGFVAATSEPVRRYAYFFSVNGDVVRVFRRTVGASTTITVATLATGSAFSQTGAAVMDPSGSFAYFGNGEEPARVIKVNLTDFAVDSSLTLNSGENRIRAGVIDPSGTFGYFGTNTFPGRVVKVHLPTMQRVASLEVPSFVSEMAITPGGARLYVMYPSGGMTEIELASFTISDTSSWSPGARSAVVDPQGRYLHVGTGTNKVLRIDLDTLDVVNEINLPTGEADLSSAVLSPDGSFAYFGTNRAVESGGTEPGQVIKMRVGAQTPMIFRDDFEE